MNANATHFTIFAFAPSVTAPNAPNRQILTVVSSRIRRVLSVQASSSRQIPRLVRVVERAGQKCEKIRPRM
jgi:hypothetical protein